MMWNLLVIHGAKDGIVCILRRLLIVLLLSVILVILIFWKLVQSK